MPGGMTLVARLPGMTKLNAPPVDEFVFWSLDVDPQVHGIIALAPDRGRAAEPSPVKSDGHW